MNLLVVALVSALVSAAVAAGLFFALRRSGPVLDYASLSVELRLNAVARSVGAHRMLLAEREGRWWVWASFVPTDAAPTVNDRMIIVAEEVPWLSDAIETTEIWARNLVAKAQPSG